MRRVPCASSIRATLRGKRSRRLRSGGSGNHTRTRRFARARSFWLPFSVACCTSWLLLCIQEPFWRFQEHEGLLFAFLICQTSASGCHWILTSVNRLFIYGEHLQMKNNLDPITCRQVAELFTIKAPEELHQNRRTFVEQKKPLHTLPKNQRDGRHLHFFQTQLDPPALRWLNPLPSANLIPFGGHDSHTNL